MKELNMAFGAKPWWKFRKQYSFWSKVLCNKYCKNNKRTLVDGTVTNSTIRKRISRIAHLVEAYLRWKVNSGNCNPILDHWLYSGKIQDDQLL